MSSDEVLLSDDEPIVSPTVMQYVRQGRIWQEIRAERKYQDSKWGGPDNDDTRSEKDWQWYISEYANAQGRAADYDFRKRMVKVAAMAVAAIESFDRKNKKE